ncbi:hypothetical protein B2J93_9407 [Marssonina coronariae]|uniref:Uncharacterized protein n=1 Tax=Diplocarpon coronariae TaxID=2795749 RepID=A0A218Z8E5_9HELO|nr:hypothetical protein B2J93_9407 [Marssonina coronariae]
MTDEHAPPSERDHAQTRDGASRPSQLGRREADEAAECAARPAGLLVLARDPHRRDHTSRWRASPALPEIASSAQARATATPDSTAFPPPPVGPGAASANRPSTARRETTRGGRSATARGNSARYDVLAQISAVSGAESLHRAAPSSQEPAAGRTHVMRGTHPHAALLPPPFRCILPARDLRAGPPPEKEKGQRVRAAVRRRGSLRSPGQGLHRSTREVQVLRVAEMRAGARCLFPEAGPRLDWPWKSRLPETSSRCDLSTSSGIHVSGRAAASWPSP